MNELLGQLIEPLCERTKQLFRPLRYAISDLHLQVSLNDDATRFVLHVHRLRDGIKYNAPTYIVNDFISRFPQRKLLTSSSVPAFYNIWTVPVTDIGAILINNIWPKERLTFTPDAKISYEYVLLRFTQQNISAKVVADYKLLKQLPKMPDDWTDHPTYPLTAYQRLAVHNMLNNEAYALFMKQGTGKTPPIINLICYKSKSHTKHMYRALIVCPKNAAKSWQRKFHQFATAPGLVTILKGGKLERVKLLIEALQKDEDSQFTAIICSYETLQRSWDAVKLLQPHICVLDESHFIKTPSTKRFKFCQQLRDLCAQRVILTGTPITNTVFDLWSQFEFLGEGLSGFSNFKAFREFYGRFETRGGFDKLIEYLNMPMLQERLVRLSFILSKIEALPELPPKRYEVVDVMMTPEQRDIYIKLQTQLAIEIETDISKNQLTANHILTKLLRLSQITSGYLVWDRKYDENGECTNTDSRKERLAQNPKIKALLDILREKSPNEKTIVFTNWVECIKMISEVLTLEGIKHVVYYGDTSDEDRQYAEVQYNTNPDIKVFLGNPAACGVALDLHGYNELTGTPDTNTTQVIYYSQDWSMMKREQSEDRAHRHVTRAPVLITDLVVSKSIDEEICNAVLNKRVNAAEMQDVSDLMTRILNTVPEVEEDDE